MKNCVHNKSLVNFVSVSALNTLHATMAFVIRRKYPDWRLYHHPRLLRPTTFQRTKISFPLDKSLGAHHLWILAQRVADCGDGRLVNGILARLKQRLVLHLQRGGLSATIVNGHKDLPEHQQNDADEHDQEDDQEHDQNDARAIRALPRALNGDQESWIGMHLVFVAIGEINSAISPARQLTTVIISFIADQERKFLASFNKIYEVVIFRMNIS